MATRESTGQLRQIQHAQRRRPPLLWRNRNQVTTNGVMRSPSSTRVTVCCRPGDIGMIVR